MSRRMIVAITGEALAELCMPHEPDLWMRITGGGVPSDAKFCGVSCDPLCGMIYVTFEHPSFPETLPGEHYPIADPVQLECRRDAADEPFLAEVS